MILHERRLFPLSDIFRKGMTSRQRMMFPPATAGRNTVGGAKVEIEETVKDFILSRLLVGKDRDPLASNESLIESGVLDSLGIIRLIQFLEDRFSFSIEDEEIVPENFESIEIISRFIQRTVSKNP
jgi:acyl carrier protein